MRAKLLFFFALTAALGGAGTWSIDVSGSTVADPWSQVRLLEGEWAGVAGGEPGVGTVPRSYQFVLGSRYL